MFKLHEITDELAQFFKISFFQNTAVNADCKNSKFLCG